MTTWTVASTRETVRSGYLHASAPPAGTAGPGPLTGSSAGVTEFTEFPGRGHWLTIDSDGAQVAQTALDFIKRFT
jgi:non-heme chloroperoxidase